MRDLISSIEYEYRRYKALAEGAMAQLADEDLCAAETGVANSIATIVWHISGNFESRFTDFLTADGEKPWRDRDGEFAPRQVTRAEMLERWGRGWRMLLETLESLTDADLGRTITIRRQPIRVHEALHRSLAHASYHVGQIVHIAKTRCGERWSSLSIPPGQSRAYDLEPTHESASAHTEALKRRYPR